MPFVAELLACFAARELPVDGDAVTLCPLDVGLLSGRLKDLYRNALLTAITGPMSSGCALFHLSWIGDISVMSRLRGHIVGVIVNKVSQNTSADGYSYYGYYRYGHFL